MIEKKAARVLKTRKLKEPIKIMEVCGTHTYQIRRFGIHRLLPDGLQLRSGPGCPVCVTSDSYIDYALTLAQQGFIVATFGDMMKVPSKGRSLSSVRAEGADIRIVYSPVEALQIALDNPSKKVVFLSVGFETTAPAIAATLKESMEKKAENFFILPGNKTVPQVLQILAEDPQLKIQGFLLPGHVSTIIGEMPYRFLECLGIPAVISGFEAEDILSSILILIDLIEEGKAKVVNNYRRAVRREGNPLALQIMREVFKESDAFWRGLGWVKGSGLEPGGKYEKRDIRKIVDLPYEEKDEGSPLCKCGDILAGRLLPTECPAFGKLCTPESPYGPCMVSSEGSCAAYYKYGG